MQIWTLPASRNYLNEVSNPTFDFEVYSYDANYTEDFAGSGQFDISKPPLEYSIVNTNDIPIYNPKNIAVTLKVWLDDLDGYNYSRPKGMMLVDYFGRPGIGQVQYFAFDGSGTYSLYLPMLLK